MKELSVLLPTYNCLCKELVFALHKQLSSCADVRYEIVVADDGSTDSAFVEQNRPIEQLPNVRYLVRKANVGRAAIRNLLAQEAQYDRLLFLDGDVKIDNPQFIARYVQTTADVVVGGTAIGGHETQWSRNLRYRYERASAHNHSAEKRSNHPYRAFRTTNFMVSRAVIAAHPFDQNFLTYGYEDVLFGKELHQAHIQIEHIDNPIVIDDYEDNAVFMQKTEESLRTLRQFSTQLQGYARILDFSRRHRLAGRLLKAAYPVIGKRLRHSLIHNKPRIFWFNIYKLMYFESL